MYVQQQFLSNSIVQNEQNHSAGIQSIMNIWRTYQNSGPTVEGGSLPPWPNPLGTTVRKMLNISAPYIGKERDF